MKKLNRSQFFIAGILMISISLGINQLLGINNFIFGVLIGTGIGLMLRALFRGKSIQRT